VLVALVLCWIAWGLLQLIPLPPSIWTLLPGRGLVVERLQAGGVDLPWLPLSLNPVGTIHHLAGLLPPLAVAATILSRPAEESMGLRWMIPLLALASLLLGVGQLLGGTDSPLYLYPLTNRDLPVGLMANANHQATLMLCAIPFLASLAGAENAGSKGGRGRDLLLVAMAMMFLIGIVICQSYAAYVLVLPVVVSSWLIARPRSLGPARYIGTGVAVLTVTVLALAVFVGPAAFSPHPETSELQLSRPAIYTVVAGAIKHFMPIGSGYGSFVPVYKLFEVPAQVSDVFVNHSHSDYLELTLEGGILGVLLVAGVLLWWTRRAVAIWFSRSASRFDRAAVVATAAIFGHSMVDYPARTSAIAAILAAGLALMAERQVRVEPEEASVGGRHLSAE
jgi:O-antigen ligase